MKFYFNETTGEITYSATIKHALKSARGDVRDEFKNGKCKRNYSECLISVYRENADGWFDDSTYEGIIICVYGETGEFFTGSYR